MLNNQTNLIYAYKKKSIDKIVYVGQTINLKDRHYRHFQIDPFNENIKEFNYPLSRGIRLYGADEYELLILEDHLPQEKLNEREIYWIAYYDTYYHGYNQSTGGANPVMPIFSEDKIDIVIEMLKDESYSYQDIIDKTGISMTHISNINNGQRRKRENIDYPIRKPNTKGTKGLKFSPEECKQIHLELLGTASIGDIAQKFNCERSTISRINLGKTKMYRLEGYDYPIRKNTIAVGRKAAWDKINKE